MGEQAILIKGITVDPEVISEAATITIDARSARGWPLEFDLTASEGSIEPTSRPNLFLWHGPKSAKKRSFLQRRLRIGARGRR
jgi:hypothetical protein